MEQLVKANYLFENQIIYTKNKEHSALVLADGSIKNSVGVRLNT